MHFVTLWTLDRKQCVLFIDPPEYDYRLRIIEDDAVLLEQVIVAIDDVLPTALTWERQYSAGAQHAADTHAVQ
jgi:hypothetical protein